MLTLNPVLFLLLALSLSAPSLSAPKCPLTSWYSEKYDTCLFLPRFKASWQGGEDYCRYMGGHLVSIDSKEKNDYILNYTNTTQVAGQVAIGAHVQGLHWQWTDGTPFNYSNFDKYNATGGPMEGATLQAWPSLHLNNRGLWYQELIRDIQSNFLCEFPVCSNGTRPTISPTTFDDKGFQHSNVANAWYLSFEDASPFEEAESICREIGGYLPIMSNDDINYQYMRIEHSLDSQMRDKYVMIGKFSDINGYWKWVDGSNSTYTNWGYNEPKVTANSYVMMAVDSSQWFAYDFKHKFNRLYSCELPMVPRNIC